MLLVNKFINKIRGFYLDIYFFFNDKILFKDKYGLSYYLYKNTRPKNTFNIGVRTDDTTVLFTINKILSSSNIEKKESIHCIDVGSYIGVITLMMSKSLEASKLKWKIHSFEPFKDTFLRLQKNVNINLFKDNIVLNNLAVSDMAGAKILKSYPDTPGQNHIEINNSFDQANNIKQTVQVITLKDYMLENNIKHINICKVDTEGSDESVIKGFYEFLDTKAIDYFIFEYQNDKSNESILNLLITKGYTIYYMVRNENFLVSSLKDYPKNSKSLLNLVAVSPNEKINFNKEFKLSDQNKF